MSTEQNEKQQERLESVAHLAGKYLTFRLAGEVYGLEVLKVQEIIRVMDVTRVPRTPEFIRGVVCRSCSTSVRTTKPCETTLFIWASIDPGCEDRSMMTWSKSS